MCDVFRLWIWLLPWQLLHPSSYMFPKPTVGMKCIINFPIVCRRNRHRINPCSSYQWTQRWVEPCPIHWKWISEFNLFVSGQQSEPNGKCADLEEVSKRQRGLAEIKTEFDGLIPSFNIISHSFSVLADTWSSVYPSCTLFCLYYILTNMIQFHDQALQFSKQLENIQNPVDIPTVRQEYGKTSSSCTELNILAIQNWSSSGKGDVQTSPDCPGSICEWNHQASQRQQIWVVVFAMPFLVLFAQISLSNWCNFFVVIVS